MGVEASPTELLAPDSRLFDDHAPQPKWGPGPVTQSEKWVGLSVVSVHGLTTRAVVIDEVYQALPAFFKKYYVAESADRQLSSLFHSFD